MFKNITYQFFRPVPVVALVACSGGGCFRCDTGTGLTAFSGTVKQLAVSFRSLKLFSQNKQVLRGFLAVFSLFSCSGFVPVVALFLCRLYGLKIKVSGFVSVSFGFGGFLAFKACFVAVPALWLFWLCGCLI